MSTITTGVELELWVIDDAGRLCDGQEITDAHERIKPEFIDSLIEIQTEPHDTELGLRRDIQQTLRIAIRAADGQDKQLVPLGTPLSESTMPANSKRGELFETIYGDGVASAKNCAGTHIHFEKENVVRQLNMLTALDPALALVSTSPYYAGEAECDSSRARAYRTKCGSEFRGFCDLWRYVDTLDEWTERVTYVHDSFKELASKRGVSVETVEKHFEPEDTVLNPVRLRQCQPTVEWRAPDSALPSQIVTLATDVGQMVAQTDSKPLKYGTPGVRRGCIYLPEFSELRELSRLAIDSGLGSIDVKNYLRTMGFDLSEYQPLSPQLSGPESLSETEVRTMRLEEARRLRDDVESLAREPTVPKRAALST